MATAWGSFQTTRTRRPNWWLLASFALHALTLIGLSFVSGNHARGGGRFGLAQEGTFSVTWIPGSGSDGGRKGEFDTIIESDETDDTAEPAANMAKSSAPLIQMIPTDPHSVFNTEATDSLVIQATTTNQAVNTASSRPEPTEVATLPSTTNRRTVNDNQDSSPPDAEIPKDSTSPTAKRRKGDGADSGSGHGQGSGKGAHGAGTGQIGFFGILARARRVVYVIDASESMRKHHAMEIAREELLLSLQDLEPVAFFQVIFFDLKPHAMPHKAGREKLLRASPANLRMAESFIKAIQPDAGTDRFLAISDALQLDPDVIFLLTDADDPEMSAKELWDIQRANKRKTAIHVVEFRIDADLSRDSFLKKLSRQNGGSHRYHDLTKSEQ